MTEEGSKSPINWGSRVLKGMQNLWKSGELCDFTIIVNQHCFPIHRAFLAAVSDYFLAMLTGGMQETYMNSVELKGVQEDGVEPLLEFLYTGELDLTKDNVCSVLLAAAYLQIESAVEYCCCFLEGAITLENVMDILEVAKLHSLHNVKPAALSYIRQHFEQIVECQDYLQLDFEEIKCVLSNDDFEYKCEFELYKRVEEWLNHEPEARSCHGYPLMKLIRFASMTPSQLDEIRSESTQFSWVHLVEEAQLYHKLPLPEKLTVQSKHTTVRSRPSIVARHIPFNTPPPNTMYSLTPPEKDWHSHHDNFSEHSILHTSAVVKNFFLVCGGHPPANKKPLNTCYIFDPQTFSWSSIASMKIPRANFSVVSCNKFIYAIGGIYATEETEHTLSCFLTNSIERYSLETKRWEKFSRTRQATQSHAACILGETIYVSGGMLQDGTGLNQMGCLNTLTKKWKNLKPLSGPESGKEWGHVMCPLQDCILVVKSRNYGLVVYSPDTDQWSRLDHRHVPRTMAVLTLRNDIYFINGQMKNAEDDGRISMKVTYDGGRMRGHTSFNSVPRVWRPYCHFLRFPTRHRGNKVTEDELSS